MLQNIPWNDIRKYLDLRRFIEWPRTRSIVTVAGLLIVLVGAVDYATGTDIDVSPFYLIPVALVTWTVSDREGFVFSVLAAVVWWMAGVDDVIKRQGYFSISAWNALMKLCFFVMVPVIFRRLKSEISREKDLARRDPLTGLANGRGFQELAEGELERFRRSGRPLTLAFFDLDNFKVINDRFGHSTGDRLLKMVARIIDRGFRRTDLVARMGGDEFVALLPTTAAKLSGQVCQRVTTRIRDAMRANHWPVTVSLGVVTFLNPPASVGYMVERADMVMYEVKSRNKDGLRHAVWKGE